MESYGCSQTFTDAVMTTCTACADGGTILIQPCAEALTISSCIRLKSSGLSSTASRGADCARSCLLMRPMFFAFT